MTNADFTTTDTTITVHNATLTLILKSLPGLTGVQDDANGFTVNRHDIARNWMEVSQYLLPLENSDSSVAEFVRLFDEPMKNLLGELTSKGMITYTMLHRYFTHGMKVVFSCLGQPRAALIKKVKLRDSFKSMTRVELRVLDVHRGSVVKGVVVVMIGEWVGCRELHTLPVRPLTDAMEQRFLEHDFELFKKYVDEGPSFRYYTGSMLVPVWNGFASVEATGRVMVDKANSYRVGNLNDACSLSDYDALPHGSNSISNQLAMTAPAYMPAFSFRLKRWGYVKLDQLSEIRFASDAFDKLVLEPGVKDVVKKLVAHFGSGHTFSDLVEGKGQGCIILLEGPPGVGKTTTAETVAELMKMPLYSLGAGDLGTNVGDLQAKLDKVLQLVGAWKAVLLLDEADVFMEARDVRDVHRNAMVSVFLRLLEYHSGVLFLTTNRVKTIDPAFNSRITLTFHYDELNRDKREQLWRRFLPPDTSVNCGRLAVHALNGREIRTVSQLATVFGVSQDSLEKLIHMRLQKRA